MTIRRIIEELRGRPLPDRIATSVPSHLAEPAILAFDRRLDEREEADLCDVLGEWLRNDGWEVFYEVPLRAGRPDVVGLRNDTTLTIKAKLSDVSSVIKQGLRIASLVDRPYIAMPVIPAGEASVILARLECERPNMRLPGLLVVGSEVHELRPVAGFARRRILPSKLRAVAELYYGAERGGVSSTDMMIRNVKLWQVRPFWPSAIVCLREGFAQ